MPDTALRTLLAGSIDYAGLFPPAGLDMAASVRQYADYRSHPDAWALGRFVVPAARLSELEQEAALFAPASQPPSPAGSNAEPWRLSALLGTDALRELEALGEFNCRHAAAGAPALSADVSRPAPIRWRPLTVCSPPSRAGPRRTSRSRSTPTPPARRRDRQARRPGQGADGRHNPGGVPVGGVRRPLPPRLHRRRCALQGDRRAASPTPRRVPVDLRGRQPARHHVRLPQRLPRRRLPAPRAGGRGRRPAAGRALRRGLRFAGDAVEWRGHRLDQGAIAAARATGIVAFGSCSFTEPVGELQPSHPPAPDRSLNDPRAALENGLSGSYVLEQELGRGGMATVYLARTSSTGGPSRSRCCGPRSP